MPATSSWELPIPSRPSVFSRFRLAGAGLMIGVLLVGVIFYGLVNNLYLGRILGDTLGPVTDTLAQVGFDDPDSDIWRRMATRHGVAILYEPANGNPLAWDETGETVSPASLAERDAPIRAVRTASDGARVTLHWTLGPLPGTHLPMLGGLLLMILAVVGAAFWFLQRQLQPLASLQTGVEALARGDLEARVKVVRDDEIGRVAEAFNRMAGRVGEMIEDRERLLADVSHELRSPIARMKVALELSPESGKRDAIGRDLKEMESLIAVLLEREQLRSRTGRLAGEQIDLEAIASPVVSVFADQGPGVALVSDGRMTMYADPALMKLLIQNLVDNAIKFSHPHSRPVRVELEGRADQILLRVVDDGIGIPASDGERLFEPFVKLDRARGHGLGYGIGLNLCQRIVGLHDGEIQLLPHEPRGTEAVVALPRCRPD